MKINNLVLVAVLVSLVSEAWAQSLPIRSQDCLRQYALKQCVYGSRSVYSESIDWNNQSNVTYVSTNGTGGEAILDGIFSQKIQYAAINTNDPMRAYSYLYDNNWNCLFFGYSEYPIGTSPLFSMWMQSIPLPIQGVDSAEVLVLGEDGKTADRITLDVVNGRPMFQSWLAGSPNGIMVLHLADGSTLTYDLWSPLQDSPDTNIELTEKYKIESHFVGHFNATNEAVVKMVETYNRPSAYIELTCARRVMFDLLGLYYQDGTTLFERPVSMDVEDQATGVVTTIPFANNAVSYQMFPIGKYRMVWNWNKFGQPNTIYTGGGKG